MKKLTLLVATAGALSLVACSDPPPERVVHHTRVVHHYHDSDQVNAPANNGNDNFEAVQKPASYSQ